jgi:K+-sensing histidine kinase KdpD
MRRNGDRGALHPLPAGDRRLRLLWRRRCPGSFATLLGGVGTWYFFIPPAWTFDPPSFVDGLSLLLYLAVVLLVCLPIYRQQRAIQRLERRSRDLWKFAALLEGASDTSRPGRAGREHKS